MSLLWDSQSVIASFSATQSLDGRQYPKHALACRRHEVVFLLDSFYIEKPIECLHKFPFTRIINASSITIPVFSVSSHAVAELVKYQYNANVSFPGKFSRTVFTIKEVR